MIKTADGVEIKVGDIVWMVVGGSPMAVVRVGEANLGEGLTERIEVECAWFLGSGHMVTASVPGAVLISAPPKP